MTPVALRLGAVAALAALAAGLPAAVPSAADAARKKRTCRSLKGRDLAPARNVKLVRRRNADSGTNLYGCVLPRGRVRLLASSADYYTSSESYTVRQVAEAIVLLDTESGSQYGGGSGTSVTDIRSGRSYGIASQCSMIGGSPCGGPPGSTAPRAFVNGRGQAAAAIVTANGVTIAGFSPRGAKTDFDSGSPQAIPPSSLRLTGSTASWTHSGEPRSAQLPG